MDTIDRTTGEIIAAPQGTPPAVAAALVKVLGKVRQLGHDASNQHGRYPFVSIDKFLEVVGPLMADAGIILMIDEVRTEVRVSGREAPEGREKPSPWLFADYELWFLHQSGAESPKVKRSIALPISGPQQFGSGQSYVQKQFLRAIFCIPTGEKDADETPTDGVPPAQAKTARGEPQNVPARAMPAPVPDKVAEAREAFNAIRARLAGAKSQRELDQIILEEGDSGRMKIVEEAGENASTALRNAIIKNQDRLGAQADQDFVP